ncbi:MULTISPECIES: hypothetical protein [unclassified Acidisoma]|jgi:hypothetical protein|uniref:hypothetical protein n=1 Tax=unclassified Acidisoma TaxID=2634065 RepID=UPI00131C6F13|nr:MULTISPECIES: hypothetical protein [unclassified Acidisoma]
MRLIAGGCAFLGALGLAACAIPGREVASPTSYPPSLVTVEQTEGQSGRVPLVTIETPVSAADYKGPLAQAVQAAEARKPDVAFDVLAAVPPNGTPTHQADAADGITPDATAVAEAIARDGVSTDRIRLGAVVTVSNVPPAVRVYVR